MNGKIKTSYCLDTLEILMEKKFRSAVKIYRLSRSSFCQENIERKIKIGNQNQIVVFFGNILRSNRFQFEERKLIHNYKIVITSELSKCMWHQFHYISGKTCQTQIYFAGKMIYFSMNVSARFMSSIKCMKFHNITFR